MYDVLKDHTQKKSYPRVTDPLMERDGASGSLSLEVRGSISESERRHFGVSNVVEESPKGLNMFGDRVMSHAD